jgi:hypothetical protein
VTNYSSKNIYLGITCEDSLSKHLCARDRICVHVQDHAQITSVYMYMYMFIFMFMFAPMFLFLLTFIFFFHVHFNGHVHIHAV